MRKLCPQMLVKASFIQRTSLQIGRREEEKTNRDEETVPANGGKGQFHLVNQSADRKERERGGERRKKEEKTVSANVGKG